MIEFQAGKNLFRNQACNGRKEREQRKEFGNFNVNPEPQMKNEEND